jgi:hypothetical protein
LPTIVATDPTFAEVAKATRYGIGFLFSDKTTLNIKGVNIITMVSFRNSAESKPDENIISARSCFGVLANEIIFEVMILKNPESRKLMFNTIIEKSRMIVLISIALNASSIVNAPIIINADEPTKAIVDRFILNGG